MHLLQLLQGMDLEVVSAFADLRTMGGIDIALHLSELASVSTTIGIGAILALIFVYYRNWKFLLGGTIAVGGTHLIVELLKFLVARPRPSGMLSAYIETGSSFPSGHAADAAALYILFAYFSLWFVPPGVYRYEMGLFCFLIILLVGASRVYLGVHYPSDVLVGWLIGATVTLLTVRWMERH